VLQIIEAGKVPGRRSEFRSSGYIVGLTALITPYPQCRHDSLEPHTLIIDGAQLYPDCSTAVLAVRTQVSNGLIHFFRESAQAHFDQMLVGYDLYG
jgi:hypothetical protein